MYSQNKWITEWNIKYTAFRDIILSNPAFSLGHRPNIVGIDSPKIQLLPFI